MISRKSLNLIKKLFINYVVGFFLKIMISLDIKIEGSNYTDLTIV